MSRFFHSGDSSSSESSSPTSPKPATSLGDDDTIELSGHGASTDAASVDALETVSSQRQVATRSQNAASARDLLTHALLEAHCVTEVRDKYQSLPTYRQPSEAAIKLEARKRYQRLCSRLAPLDLVSLGPEEDRNISLRQNVRDQLENLEVEDDSALQPAVSAAGALPMPLRRLLTEGDATTSPFSHIPGSPAASIFSDVSGFRGLYQQQITLRYASDFEEISVLGKGGYGRVYEVRHRLDGRTYAVKKVPIRPAAIAKINAGSEEALNELTAEVRSLSNLEHPNVVRYYGSWIEMSAKNGTETGSSELPSPTWVHQSSNASDSLHRVRTESGSETMEDFGFSFESRSQRSISQELSSRYDSSITFSHSDTGGALMATTQPMPTLHVQMDVYPMTLADFISPKPAKVEGIAPLAHCFHLEPSISILASILDGVEYIHSKNVVHRDLKPANIFLRHEESPGIIANCVNLSSCPACRAEDRAQPAHLSVRIGDFGLVTNIAQTADPASSPVGTEIYRPTTNESNVSPHLDMFAVGIMACELLCKFDTQMERRETLNELRQGKFPRRFPGCTEHVSSKVQECMAYMLTGDSEAEITAAEMKRRLRAILDSSAGAES